MQVSTPSPPIRKGEFAINVNAMLNQIKFGEKAYCTTVFTRLPNCKYFLWILQKYQNILNVEYLMDDAKF